MIRKYTKSPESIYIRKEFYTQMCGGCANSQQDKRTYRWRCTQDVEGYPNKSVKDCFYFRRKPQEK